MCLQIEAGIVEHIQVEVRSAKNSIYMYVFYFYLFQIYYFGLTDKSTKFPPLSNSRCEKEKVTYPVHCSIMHQSIETPIPGIQRGIFTLFTRKTC